MGFFNELSALMGQTSVAMVITRAKEGKLTIMMYPTAQKDDETFIPISITDLPEILDDNIGDIMRKHLTGAIARFDSTKAEPTTNKPASNKKSDQPAKKEEPKNVAPPPPEKKEPEKPAAPDLFSDTAEEPEGPEADDLGEGNEIDEF